MKLIAGLLSSLFAVSAQAAPTPNMQEGEWEISTKMKMSGMPMQIPPTSVRICINKQDIAEGRKTVPQQSSPDGKNKCDMVNHSVSGNTVNYKMVCTGEQKMTMTGSITYSGTSYAGKSKMEMSGGPQGNMQMEHEYAARRIGECKK